MIEYVRPVDFDSFQGVGYEHQILFVGDSCRVIASHVGAGGAAPAQHTHEVDQLYYVCKGEMQVQLGAEQFVAGPNTLVYIPAGTPHHNWNIGSEHEFHFEMLTPGPNPDKQPWEETTSTDAGGREYFLKEVSFYQSSWDQIEPGFLRTVLVRNDKIMVYLAELDGNGTGLDMHVHRGVDQFYYVLEGELTAEIGLDRFTVGPHQLVVLPAMVPHKLWNESGKPERHLTVITPMVPMQPGQRGDINVDFSLSANQP